MQDILFKVFRWLLQAAQIKFIGFTAIFSLASYFVTQLNNYLSPFVGTSALNSAFNALSPSTWYFLNLFNISFGFPLIIGAFVVRFLIRRIPFIG